MSTLNKHLRTIAASAVLALGVGVVSNANAIPVFQVSPNPISGPTTYSPFNADFISGSSSARITSLGGNNYASNGYVQYTGFSLLSGAILPGISGLGNSYGLYATFSQTFNCGSPLGIGVTCAVGTISLNLWADPYQGNIGTNADTFTGSTLGAAPSVTVNGTDVLLGSANLVIAGLAGLDGLGGAFENVNTNFLLTAAGSTVFTNPIPFYQLAFSTFNNTSSGIECNTVGCVNPTVVSINAEVGGSDFNRIPEPATLALLGIGLLGMGLSRRKM